MKKERAAEGAATDHPECFVIMPISDFDPYPTGHFRRVYEFLIAPACRKAGFVPVLGGDVKEANLIVLDILHRLHSAEMVICDLSGRNPNVLFELGFRQAFNQPVMLIKDQITERIFDISGLRDITYDHSLRIDTAEVAISDIAERMTATYEAASSDKGSVNSLVQLLSIESANIPQRSDISSDTQILLNAIRELADRVGNLESGERIGGDRSATPAASGRFHLLPVDVELSGESRAIRIVVSNAGNLPEVTRIVLLRRKDDKERIRFEIDPFLIDMFETKLRQLAATHGVRVVGFAKQFSFTQLGLPGEL